MAPTTVKVGEEGSTSDDYKIIINEKTYILGPDVPSTTTLLHFIRHHALLPGTKALCYEGGCGLCTVVAMAHDNETNELKSFSIRACQTLVYSCIGWSITTVEHLGNRHVGYDKLQTALHGFYGTQCGYCTPGFVMTMYGETQSTGFLKVDQVEKAFDGNICRCTGYRPILDAFKSLAIDAPEDLAAKMKDIEDACLTKCQKSGKRCGFTCQKGRKEWKARFPFKPEKLLPVNRDGKTWYYPEEISDVYNILKQKKSSEKVRIVVGNTGQGVFKNDGPYDIYISTQGVKELYTVSTSPSLIIGANVNLNRCIEIFREAAKNSKGYHHLEEVAKHWQFVANVGVRNTGSWAGNLKMKYDHPGFASDIFISLVALDARIGLGRGNDDVLKLCAQEFLEADMADYLILSMEIPQQSEKVRLREYKITPRAVNAHAYVNASFKFQVDQADEMRVINRPAIVLGGINPSFVRASRTEKFLLGRQLSSSEDVKAAVKILGEEVKPDSHPQDESPEFRTSLAQSLLYKAILSILDNAVSENVRSGGETLTRPISTSKQTFDKNEDTWPVGQPYPKLESEIQISGEAEYLDDIPPFSNELYGAFVQSTIARGTIASIDASECLNTPGVVDFITAEHIKGKNTFYLSTESADPIFADKQIKYGGQAIGLVVAENRELASEAAKLVKITYENVQKPVLTIQDAIKEGRVKNTVNFLTNSEDPITNGDVEVGFKNSKHILEGEVSLGSQFHFQMEPLAGRVVPTEDGYDVWSTTQWPTETQNTVASCLGVPTNSVNLSVRRLGGGYGGKITRANIVVAAAAVAAQKIRQPVRVALDLTTHMTLVGWREPYYAKYKVGIDDIGNFQAISIDIYSDVGHVGNDNSTTVAAVSIPSIYYSPNWKITPYYAITDTAANTWCRTPGHLEGIATIENIIERVAHAVKKDPLYIREINLTGKDKPQFMSSNKEDNLVKSTMLDQFKDSSEYQTRKEAVEQFNKVNRWRKRGISVIPLRYEFGYFSFFHYNVHVVIYEHDGSVAIKHGGIEMGQGINTKVAQVAAKVLGVPLDIIQVKQTDSFTGANSAVTGGSHGSDLNPHGVKVCCERIRERMDEVAKNMQSTNGPVAWKDLVKECFAKQVDISERYFTFAKEHPKGYDIWALICTEIELDVLTGNFMILRADILEDSGRSLSPYVDIGQIEGAYIMGVGFFTSEKVKFEGESGLKLSNSTWEYKPPTALDIPVDFRVTLLPKAGHPHGVMGSKATGEPPLCLSYSVVSSLREAIRSAREDQGVDTWFEMDTPLTVAHIYQLCHVKPIKIIF